MTGVVASPLVSEVDPDSVRRQASPRLLPTDLRNLQSTTSSTFNPEGIYV